MDWPMITATAGQAEVGNTILLSKARPPLAHTDPAFLDLFEQTIALLRQVFQTRHDVIIMPGDAVLGLEAAAACLFSPGDKVLNLVSGVYGKGFERFIRRFGGEVLELAVPFNEAIDPDDVRKILRGNRGIKFLSAVHCEAMSGTVNPIDAIGRIAKEYNLITIVDTVAGLGAHEFLPDAWGIDAAIAAPKKCLGGAPGLCLLSVSPLAWRAMERKEMPLRGSYLSILDWKEAWRKQRQFPMTPAVSEVYALESALRQILEVGMEKHIARYAMIAAACRTGIRALGLELWPAREEIAANAVTAVQTPEGVTDQQLVNHMRQKYGVMISAGRADLAGKLFHLGHMGRAAHPSSLAAELAILELALADLGVVRRLGVGVGAAMAALQDWDTPPASGRSGARSNAEQVSPS